MPHPAGETPVTSTGLSPPTPLTLPCKVLAIQASSRKPFFLDAHPERPVWTAALRARGGPCPQRLAQRKCWAEDLCPGHIRTTSGGLSGQQECTVLGR